MRSVFAITVAALAGLSAAQVDLSALPTDLSDITADDVQSLVDAGFSVPTALPTEIQSVASRVASDVQNVVSPTATPSADDSLPDLVSQLPDCAVQCLDRAANATNCGIADFACLCSNAEQLASSLTSCVTGGDTNCGLSDLPTAARVAPQICDKVNDNPSSEDLASASRIVDQALSTSAPSAGSSNDDSGAGSLAATFGLLSAAVFVALAL